jgi:hypothetical protein
MVIKLFVLVLLYYYAPTDLDKTILEILAGVLQLRIHCTTCGYQ